MSILLLLLFLLLAFSAVWVLLSNLFLRYEAVNGDPALLANGDRRRSFSLRPPAAEIFLLALTVLLRPAGWFMSDRGRVRRPGRMPAGETPVLLLHGLFHNGCCWWWIRRCLQGRGLPVVVINMPLWNSSMETLTAMVARKVDELRIAYGVERIRLVGYSMGGLVARHYLLNGGAGKVDRCILLGTPNGGSKLAAFAISPRGKSLLPGSGLLTALARAGVPAGVRMTAISSRDDNLVLPPANARLEGARNLELEGMQHTGLLYHPRSVNALIAELTEVP